MRPFKSILAFQKHFDTDDKCRQFLEEQRWGGEPCCPFCGSVNVCRFSDGKRFKCREKECRKKFTVTLGTMYENTKIPLTKWFLAQYMLCVHSKGISSLQLATWLDVTQKTAWFLNHRIREMLADRDPRLLDEIVEIDETYIGGKDINRHFHKKRGAGDKTMVIGAVKRGGKLKTQVIPEASIDKVSEFIVNTVVPDSTMVTDESRVYGRVKQLYKHETVKHKAKEYVRGIVHTNTIEGYWNILKKQINGIHHSISPKHLQRYCNESAYRYNRRAITQDERFAEAIKNCNGRLKYKELIQTNEQ